jgi:hypothetical protein
MSQLAAIGGWFVSFAHMRQSPLKCKPEGRMPPLPLNHPHDGYLYFVIIGGFNYQFLCLKV